MSEAFGGLLANLGKNMMQFADVQHSTKISSLEAEAQSRKELRLQEMQLSQNDITNAFRVADYESSQERLGIAQAADLRAQEKHDKTSYIWKEVPKYGWVEETVTEYDPMLQENVEKIKKNWEKIGSNWMGINEDDPKDRVVIGADGSYLSGDEANSILQSATESGSVSDSTGGGEITFAEYEANFRKQKPSYKGTPEEQEALRKWAEGKGVTFIDSASAAETPTAGAETDSLNLAPDAGGTYPEFPELKGPDVPWYQKQIIPEGPTVGEVAEDFGNWVAESAQDDNPKHQEIFAKVIGLPMDVITSIINNTLLPKGQAIKTPIAGSKWLIENTDMTFAQLIERIKEGSTQDGAIAPGGAVIDEAALDAAAEASDPATIAAEFGFAPQGVTDGEAQASGSGVSTDATATSELGTAVQTGVEDTMSAVVPNLPSSPMDISPGGAVIDEAALDAAAEASDPATIAAEFGAPVVVGADGGIYAYDEAKSEAFVEGLIKDMQAVNISQEDIRKELLTLLGEIPKEQANGEFAKALATAYYEFTKGSN